MRGSNDIFFFLSGFSFTDGDNLQKSRGKEGLHPLKNIEILISSYVSVMSTSFFKSQRLNIR